MTAGSGIEHSEMPEQEQGLLDGFQLWVNLPAAKKMQQPRYQEFEPEQIPLEQRNNGTQLRVIAGTTSQGTSGVVSDISATPVYFDITLPKGKTLDENIPEGHNAFIYVIDGTITINSETRNELQAKTLGVLTQGDAVEIEAQTDSRFLLIAGKPFKEPVARYGPFVMNTQDEIHQAFADYRDGLFGKITQEQVE